MKIFRIDALIIQDKKKKKEKQTQSSSAINV